MGTQPSHPDPAASLLGLCKAFSFDCLVPCVRGRILSAEKSLVRASAAVERTQIWSHPCFFLVRPVQPRNTGVTQNRCSPFMYPLKAQGQGCCDTTVPAMPPSPAALHGATCALRKPAQGPASTLRPGLVRGTGGAASNTKAQEGALSKLYHFPNSIPSWGIHPHFPEFCWAMEYLGHLQTQHIRPGRGFRSKPSLCVCVGGN